MSAWEGSTRRSRLPPDWPVRRARVLRRDPVCTSCRLAPSTDVDHIRPGDDHGLDNLTGLCTECHGHKSGHEGAAASVRRRAMIRAARKRPAEPHPGGMTI